MRGGDQERDYRLDGHVRRRRDHGEGDNGAAPVLTGGLHGISARGRRWRYRSVLPRRWREESVRLRRTVRTAASRDVQLSPAVSLSPARAGRGSMKDEAPPMATRLRTRREANVVQQ
ncbi:hypothetical protein SESBI_26660 [Sesbania bispinosa]|nr:hypothetical protein SESBI_26660 [Sesbania bispinosa]